MTAGRIAVAVVLIIAIGSFFVFDLGRFLTFETLESLRTDSAVARFIAAYPGWSRAAYFGIYVTVAAFPLPVAGAMTVAGGAIFGLGWGLVLASFASDIGSTLAFLVSRKLLGEWVQRRFAKELAGVNAGMKRNGCFYLLSLRMVPLVPFFVLNLVMGLTRMGVFSFYAVSQAGMLAVIFVYVFAGTRLAELKSPGDVLDTGLIAAVVLLGLFPLAAKKLITWINRRGEKAAHLDGRPVRGSARAPPPCIRSTGPRADGRRRIRRGRPRRQNKDNPRPACAPRTVGLPGPEEVLHISVNTPHGA